VAVVLQSLQLSPIKQVSSDVWQANISWPTPHAPVGSFGVSAHSPSPHWVSLVHEAGMQPPSGSPHRQTSLFLQSESLTQPVRHSQ
jgi:hypothetical protein